MYDSEYEKIKADEADKKAIEPEKTGCLATWGNCDKDNPANARIFGKPTETPHRCVGKVARHVSKLHVCETCGSAGHRIQPSPYSKAGAQLRRLILDNAGVK